MMMHKVFYQRDDIEETMCQEKNVEEDLPVLKIVWMHQYKDLKITLERVKKD